MNPLYESSPAKTAKSVVHRHMSIISAHIETAMWCSTSAAITSPRKAPVHSHLIWVIYARYPYRQILYTHFYCLRICTPCSPRSLVIKDNTNTAIMITKKYIILLNITTPSLHNKKQKTGYSIPSSVFVNICGLCLYYSHTTPALLSLSNTVT